LTWRGLKAAIKAAHLIKETFNRAVDVLFVNMDVTESQR
jgi:hypothetical protein